uniref:Uncharacterized protein n=1 Tax=Ditylenchus dipsaci TaxID=166011 RepID=A0A915EIT4_9BILA
MLPTRSHREAFINCFASTVVSIERNRPEENWVRKTRRQELEESELRNLLNEWLLMKGNLEPETTPVNSKYIEFLQVVYENFRHRHLLAPIETFQPDEEQVEVDEIEIMGLNVDDIDAPANEEFPQEENLRIMISISCFVSKCYCFAIIINELQRDY